jgi:hypothetical protein
MYSEMIVAKVVFLDLAQLSPTVLENDCIHCDNIKAKPTAAVSGNQGE